MPELHLERYGTKRPLLKLPPSGVPAGEPVEIYVEIGKAEAGCYICRRPIPAGTSRVSFVTTVEVVEELAAPAPLPTLKPSTAVHALGHAGPVAFIGPEVEFKNRRQTYNVHPGCLTRPMGSEAIRHGTDCWDCGARGIDDDTKSNVRSGWGSCFTTHRFAWGVLCDSCQRKPKWLQCGHCQVWFPRHLINFGQLPDDHRRYGVDEENPRQEQGDWCAYCADRFQVMTAEQIKEAREEFEETRQRIMKGGLF